MSADQIERRLAAILAADVEGYSRLIGIDEVTTLRTLAAHRRHLQALSEEAWAVSRVVGASSRTPGRR